jgi:hypothetical protein
MPGMENSHFALARRLGSWVYRELTVYSGRSSFFCEPSKHRTNDARMR